MSIRALAAIFLAGRETSLKGAWPKDGTQVCEDVQAAYRVVRSVGSQFAKEDIWPHAALRAGIIHAGNWIAENRLWP